MQAKRPGAWDWLEWPGWDGISGVIALVAVVIAIATLLDLLLQRSRESLGEVMIVFVGPEPNDDGALEGGIQFQVRNERSRFLRAFAVNAALRPDESSVLAMEPNLAPVAVDYVASKGAANIYIYFYWYEIGPAQRILLRAVRCDVRTRTWTRWRVYWWPIGGWRLLARGRWQQTRDDQRASSHRKILRGIR